MNNCPSCIYYKSIKNISYCVNPLASWNKKKQRLKTKEPEKFILHGCSYFKIYGNLFGEKIKKKEIRI